MTVTRSKAAEALFEGFVPALQWTNPLARPPESAGSAAWSAPVRALWSGLVGLCPWSAGTRRGCSPRCGRLTALPGRSRPSPSPVPWRVAPAEPVAAPSATWPVTGPCRPHPRPLGGSSLRSSGSLWRLPLRPGRSPGPGHSRPAPGGSSPRSGGTCRAPAGHLPLHQAQAVSIPDRPSPACLG